MINHRAIFYLEDLNKRLVRGTQYDTIKDIGAIIVPECMKRG